MIVLGIETSCDETGIALYDSARLGDRPRAGLLAQALHSQVRMHEEYGGVVPELASRDHVRRVLPLTRRALADAGLAVSAIDAVAYTQGPGLAGALLVGAGVACGLACALRIPAIPVHHLEGHLLSPLLSERPPSFPFVALLVSGGHTQLLRVDDFGHYTLLGDSIDDAAGEAFDKSAKLLGLGYPGGPALSGLARSGVPGRHTLPRPLLHSPTLDFSFSGLKTAVANLVRQAGTSAQGRADVACAVEDAIVDILVAKSRRALQQTSLGNLVIAGGVSANRVLRERFDRLAIQENFAVHYPEPALCTDNGAMIAFAGAWRAERRLARDDHSGFEIRPRWSLETAGRG